MLITNYSDGQGVERSRYTSVNVFSEKPKTFNAIPDNEFTKPGSCNFSKDYKKSLNAFITDSTTKGKFYNSSLLIGYLDNNSGDTLLID